MCCSKDGGGSFLQEEAIMLKPWIVGLTRMLYDETGEGFWRNRRVLEQDARLVVEGMFFKGVGTFLRYSAVYVTERNGDVWIKSN